MTSIVRRRGGYVLTAIVALFLALDAALKVLVLTPAVQGTTQLGYRPNP